MDLEDDIKILVTTIQKAAHANFGALKAKEKGFCKCRQIIDAAKTDVTILARKPVPFFRWRLDRLVLKLQELHPMPELLFVKVVPFVSGWDGCVVSGR
jgi:hypothetical protein